MTRHLVLAIVDKQEADTAIWRVETTPGFEPLSGAWITSDAEEVESLTRDAVTVPAGSVDTIVEALREAGVKDLPNLEEEPPYTGEPRAEAAWSTAMKAAKLVEAWHVFETRRRQRDGDEIRPLPVS